ncbi:hypothetical protein ACBQ88_17170 [Citrobacter braakii]|uniref:hypothetical protein n=1 Tax=Citrobacter braakii TaxID=57706 RepID=UPI0035250D2B
MRALWNFIPDWTSAVTEILSWKTDVLTSPTGAEQRIARRITPRRTFEFTVELSGDERRIFENMLYQAGGSEWDFPIFPDVLTLQHSLSAGAVFIPAETNGRDFVTGDSVLIMDWNGKTETAIINSIYDDGLKVSALKYAWLSGCAVFPLRPAVLTDPPARLRQTDELARWQTRFRIAAHTPALADAGITRWRGHPVLTTDPDRTNDLTGEYARIMSELDNQTGIPYRMDSAGRAFNVQSFTWYAAGRTEQTTLRRLFYYLRGRQRPVWVPGDVSDFIPVNTSGNKLETLITDYSAYGVMNGRRDLYIRLTDGSTMYRRIVSARTANKTELLTLNDVLPPAEQILNISFMTLSRLVDDDVTFEHITDSDGLASVTVNFKGVRDELE